jgi:hypothetical protein
MRRIITAAFVALALAGAAGCGDDDGAAPGTMPMSTDCLLDEGVKVTEEQLHDEFCAFASKPTSYMGMAIYQCDGGTEMWAAGANSQDPDGGWAILDDGRGVWHLGPYGKAYGTECVEGGSL